MRIFVTGATGVIGRRAVPNLIASGHAVTAVARSPEARAALAGIGATAVEVDLFAANSVLAAVAGHDAVINLATHMPASSARVLLPGAWRENDRLRREAAATLADAASRAGVTRLIQESFAPVYPDCGEASIDETTPIRPVRYNRTVADAERAAERFTDRGGAGVVLRFAWFYGPDSRFLRELTALARHGFAPLFGRPRAFISSVSHDDAAQAVVSALSVASGTYNVSDDQPLRHREFVDALADAIGVSAPRLPPPWVTPLAGSVGELMSRSQRMSNTKLRAYGWTPRCRSVREGFRDVARELSANQPRSSAHARPHAG